MGYPDNRTLTNSSGNWNFNNVSMPNGVYTAIFWCNDTSSNMNYTNITFTVLLSLAAAENISSGSGSGTDVFFNIKPSGITK